MILDLSAILYQISIDVFETFSLNLLSNKDIGPFMHKFLDRNYQSQPMLLQVKPNYGRVTTFHFVMCQIRQSDSESALMLKLSTAELAITLTTP